MKQFLPMFAIAAIVLSASSCKKNDMKQIDQSANATTTNPSNPSSTNLSAKSAIIKVSNPELNLSRGGGGSAFGDNSGCTTCLLQYPDASNMPRSGVVFNESDVLVASNPGPTTCTVGTQLIKLWYSDEHAMTLGVRQVIVKSASGVTTTTNYPFSLMTNGNPQTILNPLVGTTIPDGDQSGCDVSAGGGRPLMPILYITDITDDQFSRSGDWQQNPENNYGFAPNRVSGTWKAAVKYIDKTHNPALTTITMDADPASKNHWNLAGGDAPPVGVIDDGYGCEAVWVVANLGLQKGHKYRILFMVHDGDQNKAGGDSGEACITIIADGNNTVHSPD